MGGVLECRRWCDVALSAHNWHIDSMQARHFRYALIQAVSLAGGFFAMMIDSNIVLATEPASIDSAKRLDIALGVEGHRPASMSILCSGGKLHLLVASRLPGPRSAIEGAHDDVVSVLVGRDINQELHVVADLLSKGGGGDDEGGPSDKILTGPLSSGQLDHMERWFGATPPAKVAFVGFLETGVFMKGIVAGLAIQDFRTSCGTTEGKENDL